MSNFEALDVYLKPITTILSRDGINEISINQPNEAWVEKKGDMYKVKIEGYDLAHLKSFAHLEDLCQRIRQKFVVVNIVQKCNKLYFCFITLCFICKS